MATAAVDPGESTPATAAMPRAGPARPDPARRVPVTPRELGFTPFRDPPPPPREEEGALPNSSEGEIQAPEWKSLAGSQAGPETEGVRTPASLVKSTHEALAQEAFTDERHAQLDAQILVNADLCQGKPLAKAAIRPARDSPPLEGALPNSPEEVQTPECKPYARSQALPETVHVRTPVSWVKSTREALTHKAFAYELHAQLDAQILVNPDLSQGKPPAKSALRPMCNPPLERALTDSLEEIQTPEWKPYAGSQAVPDTEGVRTPGSSLKNTCEALAHEAFTDEQHAQLYAHILITADLKQGKPPSKAAMVLAFGQPVEGQKHAWEEVWRAAVDRYQNQMSPLGFETPFSSQNGPLEPSPNSMKNFEEFELKEAHSELVDAQTSKWQNQKSPMTGFETPIKSVIGNCAAQGLDVQNGGEVQLAVSCADKLDQEPPDDRKIKNTIYGGLESRCGSTPSESSESLTELDSCVKCGKDGQLLKCSSCFLAAHASCFGSSVTFDDSGHFDCPVCYCRKAAKAMEKAKKTYSEARKNLSVFCSGWKQFSKEHSELMNGFHTAKKQGQSEAAELCRKDGEPSHLKENGTSDAGPEKVVTTKTTIFSSSENAKSHGDSNSNLSREAPYSARDRFSSVANRNIGVGKENCLMNSPNCNFSDRLGAISSRNISRRKVSFQEMGTVAPNSTWKTLRYQDQFVHSPARKRYYPCPPEHYYSPHTPAMRSLLAPRKTPYTGKTPFTSTTARRKMVFWTEAEEAALREAVAKLAPKGEAAKEKRSISWVRIHDYCRESIHPTRCPDDLRKKWNRMKNKLGVCPEDGSVGGDSCF
ncbi:hypothetical protein VPH35_087235 [Triticum aestivum]|uniref:Myb-like domain-containing protein n=1 Tax=Triticum aestivum TaxID=4565 RepID=A0A3B6KS08_WHEAT|nr:uncharacterized protein LOC123106109 isoform X2 [Triticum aestivum]